MAKASQPRRILVSWLGSRRDLEDLVPKNGATRTKHESPLLATWQHAAKAPFFDEAVLLYQSIPTKSAQKALSALQNLLPKVPVRLMRMENSTRNPSAVSEYYAALRSQLETIAQEIGSVKWIMLPCSGTFYMKLPLFFLGKEWSADFYDAGFADQEPCCTRQEVPFDVNWKYRILDSALQEQEGDALNAWLARHKTDYMMPEDFRKALLLLAGLAQAAIAKPHIAPLLCGPLGSGKRLAASFYHYALYGVDAPPTRTLDGADPQLDLDQALQAMPKDSLAYLYNCEKLSRTQQRALARRLVGGGANAGRPALLLGTTLPAEQLAQQDWDSELQWPLLRCPAVALPALRDWPDTYRQELVKTLLRKANCWPTLPLPETECLAQFKQNSDYGWPGNILELQARIEQALLRHVALSDSKGPAQSFALFPLTKPRQGGKVLPAEFPKPPAIEALGAGAPLANYLEKVELYYLREAEKKAGANRQSLRYLAELLGCSTTKIDSLRKQTKG